MTMRHGRPFSGPPLQVSRRILPVAIATGATILLAMVPPAAVTPTELIPTLVFAGVLTVVHLALALTRWDPSPVTQTAISLSFLGLVVLGRVASEGRPAGFAPLALVPVLWLALYGSRAQLATAVAAVGLSWMVPILLIGGTAFPLTGWHSAAAWTVAAVLIGTTVQGLTRSLANSVTEAHEAHDRERQHAANVATVAAVVRGITGVDARERLCEAAREVSDAALATISQPDEFGFLNIVAHVGLPAGADDIRPVELAVESSVSGHVLDTGKRYFVPDCRAEPRLGQRFVTTFGVASALFEPIFRGDEVVGVLAVGWTRQVTELSARGTEILALLAAEAGTILERADLLNELAEQSRTDALTGLPNRRAWDETITREMAAARRRGTPLCVAMLDLDFFKRFNDEHGHAAGDRMLIEAGVGWSAALRAGDVLARFGGEEFLVALPECDLANAHRIVDRLRAATPSGETCSAGLGEWHPDESAAELVARADAALYAAKRAGRARTALATA